MAKGEGILVPVNEREMMRRVIDYVGTVIAGRGQVVVYLFHRLPSLPPQLREHGGSEDSERETQLSDELERDIHEWVTEQRDRCHLVLNEARDRLTAAGLPADAVRMQIGKPVFADEELGDALRRTADDLGCRTIVLPHEHGSAMRDIFRRRSRDRVGSRVLAVWLVG